MVLRSRFNRWSFIPIFVFIIFSTQLSLASEQITVSPAESEAQKIKLIVGKSQLINILKPVNRVSVGNPEVADVVVTSPKQIHVNAKAPGVTSMILWGRDGVCTFLDLEVCPDISGLKQKVKEIIPDDNIKINGAHDSIILSGEVSSASNLASALSLAEPFAPKKVVNLMQVGGVQQVMIEVRVAEMSRTLIRQLGINFNFANQSGDFGVSLLGGITSLAPYIEQSQLATGGAFGMFVSPVVNALFRFNKGSATWTNFIDALREDRLVKILAEPTLTTLSGQEASFLAGGEFPIPVPQVGMMAGAVTIEYKQYGVGLVFTPTVLSSDKISMRVSPEVSELDFAAAVVIAGYEVPGLTVRRASTVIELADGQSFAIAGLLKDEVRQIVSKFPLLGDIPVLGALFRSSSFQKNESELVIIVTPHLVKPLDMAKQILPTDHYVEPDDFEFYLLGAMEGKRLPMSPKGEMEGPFGHISP